MSTSTDRKPPRILCGHRFLASLDNLARTVAATRVPSWASRVPWIRSLWIATTMVLRRRQCQVALVTGDATGFAFSALQRLMPGRKIPTVMMECNWYREPKAWRRPLKRWQMRFCLKAVDKCIVWAEREIEAYSKEFAVDANKFIFVPQHTSLHPHRYSFTVREGDYILAAGNYDRDFRTFVEAIRPLSCPCVIACRTDLLPKDMNLPAHVRHVWASPAEFRQLMAGSMFVVVPMQAGLLHSGGQQGFVNAMALGKAVVVSDPAGASSYIQHGITGLLVPPDNPEAMRDQIQFLLANPESRKKIGDKAATVTKSWTLETIYDRICAIADDAASSKQQRRFTDVAFAPGSARQHKSGAMREGL